MRTSSSWWTVFRHTTMPRLTLALWVLAGLSAWSLVTVGLLPGRGGGAVVAPIPIAVVHTGLMALIARARRRDLRRLSAVAPQGWAIEGLLPLDLTQPDDAQGRHDRLVTLLVDPCTGLVLERRGQRVWACPWSAVAHLDVSERRHGVALEVRTADGDALELSITGEPHVPEMLAATRSQVGRR